MNLLNDSNGTLGTSGQEELPLKSNVEFSIFFVLTTLAVELLTASMCTEYSPGSPVNCVKYPE